MLGSDEIIFIADYNGLKKGIRYDLSNASEKDVASVLVNLSDYIEPYAYRFVGVDYDALEAQIPSSVSPADFLKDNKKLWTSTCKGELKSIIESCFLNILLRKANIPFKPVLKMSLQEEKQDLDSGIFFIAKYNNWVAIKKLGAEGKKPHELGGLLAGIDSTIINKSYDLLSMERPKTKGRKSFNALVDVLESLDPKDPAHNLGSLESLGFTPYPTLEVLVKIYPDLKIPKRRGRKK